MTEAIVPLDVEAAVTAYLAGLGVDARTTLGATRAPGMVRVSRTGGVPGPDDLLDEPIVLIESWGADHGDSWDRAVTIYGHLFLAARGAGIPGLYTRSITPTPPVSNPDRLAPDLHRHQLTVSLVCGMGLMDVPDPGVTP